MKDVIIIGGGYEEISVIRGFIGAYLDMECTRTISDTLMWFDDSSDWVVPTVNARANGKCKNPKKGRW